MVPLLLKKHTEPHAEDSVRFNIIIFFIHSTPWVTEVTNHMNDDDDADLRKHSMWPNIIRILSPTYN